MPVNTAHARAGGALDPLSQKQLRKNKVGSLVMIARRALLRGHKEKAYHHLEMALELDNADRSAIELLGEYFMASGEQEKALRVFIRGRNLYPQYAPFKKNIDVCISDLEEMKRAQEEETERLKEEFLGIEAPPAEVWVKRKPLLAGLMSLLPGVGQFYNRENPRGGVLLAGWIATFIAWGILLVIAFQNLPAVAPHTLSAALGQTSEGVRLGFWIIFATWVGFYVYAIVDAFEGASRANNKHERDGD